MLLAVSQSPVLGAMLPPSQTEGSAEKARPMPSFFQSQSGRPWTGSQGYSSFVTPGEGEAGRCLILKKIEKENKVRNTYEAIK